MAKFVFSPRYEASLRAIEDFIFKTTSDVTFVEGFLNGHDQALEFIGRTPEAAALHPETGDRSWPLADGRYRIFFILRTDQTSNVILLTDIIDNRQINSEIYPGNSLPTFDIDD